MGLDIKPYAQNAKDHPDHQLELLARVVQEVGWRQNVEVNQQGVIVAGHGRYLAYERFKDKYDLPPLWVTDDTGKTLHGEHATTPLTEEQERMWRLADNQINALTSFNMELVIEELKGLTEPMIDLTGFDKDLLLDDPYADGKQGALAEKFVAPPFTVLDTRQGYWKDRKQQWHALIGDNGESRENTLADEGSIMEGINNGVSLLDPVLAEIMVRWFCPPGGTTIDPFAGDTVFGYVSARLGNPFIGIELRKEQADLNNKRVEGMQAKYVCDDGQNIAQHLDPASADMIFSCPPYFDLEQYSDLPNDASNQDYEGFLQILENAFTGALTRLKDDRFAVVVIGDVRDKNGFYYGIPDAIKAIFTKNDAKLYNEAVLVEPIGTLPLRVQNSMRNRKLGKCHQNILVFYKGNPNNIQANYPTLTYASEDLEL